MVEWTLVFVSHNYSRLELRQPGHHIPNYKDTHVSKDGVYFLWKSVNNCMENLCLQKRETEHQFRFNFNAGYHPEN